MEGARASLVKGKRVGGSSEGGGINEGWGGDTGRAMERLTCTLIEAVWMSCKYRVCKYCRRDTGGSGWAVSFAPGGMGASVSVGEEIGVRLTLNECS